MKPKAERNQLSRREDEVLRLASTGLTDQQIANVLNIRVSTVTTYWVRIRGKVGQLSRAELVSLAVRKRSQETVNELRAEVERLKMELSHKDASEAEALQSMLAAKASLDLLPSGMLIVKPDGGVALSNSTAARILGRDSKQMESLSIADVIPQIEAELSRRTNEVAVLEKPPASFAVRHDGSVLPARVQTQALDGPSGGWTVVLLEPAPI